MPKPHLKRLGSLQQSYSVDHSQACAHGLLRIVLIRVGVTEIDKNTVTHATGDKAAEPGHDLGDALLVGADHFMKVFDIKMYGERRRADKIAEHHGEVATFGERNACRQAGAI